MKTVFALISVCCAITAIGCSPDYDIVTACTRELGFSVDPPAKTITIAQSFTPVTRAWSCGGRETVPIDIHWSSSDSTIIRVTPDGAITGVAKGSARANGVDHSPYSVSDVHVDVTVTE